MKTIRFYDLRCKKNIQMDWQTVRMMLINISYNNGCIHSKFLCFYVLCILKWKHICRNRTIITKNNVKRRNGIINIVLGHGLTVISIQYCQNHFQFLVLIFTCNLILKPMYTMYWNSQNVGNVWCWIKFENSWTTTLWYV